MGGPKSRQPPGPSPPGRGGEAASRPRTGRAGRHARRWWSEALVLAAEADATVLVARAGHTRWKALAELARILHRDRFPVIGAVLVGAGPTRRPPGRRDRRAGGDPSARSSSGAPQVPMRTVPPNGRNGNGSGSGSWARDRRGRSREH